MTYTFYNPAEGRHIIYDTASGAVIRCGEIEAYICDALDPCGDGEPLFSDKCPSEIRYELARFSSTEVSAAYNNVKGYYSAGLIYGISNHIFIRNSGEHSADETLIPLIMSNAGVSENQAIFI